MASIAAFIADRAQRRINIDIRFDAYVISNLCHNVVLLAGWSAFAAPTVCSFIVAAPAWIAVILHLVGFLSSYGAFIIISSVYRGHIYRVVNLPLALTSSLAFAVWPAGGRVIYGWFFDLYQR